jgi:tetratricopeptide (TPR) repeat protein
MDFMYWLISLIYGLLLLFVTPIYLGIHFYRHERYQAALRCFRLLYRLTPLNPRWRGPAACYLAATYSQLDDYETARTYAEEAVRENGRRKYRKLLLNSQLQLGAALSLQGEYEQAEQLFDEALSGATKPEGLRRWVEIHAASTYLMRGRLDDAEKLLQDVLAAKKIKPEMQINAYCMLGISKYYRQDLPAALRCAQQALSIKAEPAWARIMALSDVLLFLAEMGNLEEAGKIEAELIPLLPTKPARLQQRALRSVAQLALARGDLDRARDYAERAERADLNPSGHAAALLIQAEVFAARHNANRAVRLCEAVLESNAVEFYKARARALQQRLLLPITAITPPGINQRINLSGADNDDHRTQTIGTIRP